MVSSERHSHRPLTSGRLTATVLGAACALAICAAPAGATQSFAPADNVAVASSPYAVAVADFNGDGDRDAAIADGDASVVQLSLGDGQGGLAPPTAIDVGFGPLDVTAADLDGDADSDLVTANSATEAVTVLVNDGSGVFTRSDVDVGQFSQQRVVVGNLTGSAAKDLLVTTAGDAAMVLPGDGLGGFGAPVPLSVPASSSPQGAAIADFTADGRNDALVVNTGANNFSLTPATAAGGFGSPVNYSTGGQDPGIAAVADLSGDGRPDVAVGNGNTGSSSVGVRLGQSGGTLAAPTALGSGGSSPSYVVAEDFDADGDREIAVANLNSNNVGVLDGNGDGTFASAVAFGAGSAPSGIATGDLDNDGDRDMVVSNLGDGTVSVLLNQAVAGPDTTDPVLDLPATITRTANGPGGEPVNYSVTATDDRDPSPEVSCSPASGSTFAIGTTSVNCTATDNAGNSDAGSFDVVVNADTADPVLSVPATITRTSNGPGGERVNYSVTATDNRDPSPNVSCSPPSGHTFPVGTTQVSCTATDGSGNQATDSFDVVVNADTTDPVLDLPDPITVTTNSPSGKVVNFSATASDNRDPSPGVTCSPVSGSNFPLGTTSVSCTATDASGNEATGSFNVTVNGDTTDPVLELPDAISVDAVVPSGKQVPYSVSATDNKDSNPVVECSPASNSNFAVGTTSVNCTATDDFGNVAEGSFDVTVTPDVTEPVLTVPAPFILDSWSPAGRRLTFTYSASDDRDTSPTRSCSPASGTTFAIGARTVRCTATDNFGNVARRSFKVTVRDTGLALNQLISAVQDLQVGAGLKRSLLNKVQGARSDYLANSRLAACSDLAGFLVKVRDQSGKAIPRAKARSLIRSAENIRDRLSC